VCSFYASFRTFIPCPGPSLRANGRVHPYCNDPFWWWSEMVLDCLSRAAHPRAMGMTWQSMATRGHTHASPVHLPTSHRIGSIETKTTPDVSSGIPFVKASWGSGVLKKKNLSAFFLVIRSCPPRLPFHSFSFLFPHTTPQCSAQRSQRFSLVRSVEFSWVMGHPGTSAHQCLIPWGPRGVAIYVELRCLLRRVLRTCFM
jgi:hypothetical protein